MSLKKGIKYGKEHRKEYTGAKAVSSICRNGGCIWCNNNKFYNNRKRLEKAKYSENDIN